MSKITNYKFIADFYDWKYKRNSKRNTNNRPCANPKRLRHFVIPVIILLATISVVVFADTIIRDSGYSLTDSVFNFSNGVVTNNITSEDGTIEVDSNLDVSNHEITSKNITISDFANINTTIINETGIYIPANTKRCFDGAGCNVYQYYNGSDLITKVN